MSDDAYIVGAMQKPDCNLDDIEILSTKFSKVGKTTLEKYKNLKVVITRGHGCDYVDQKLCDDKGVKVIRLNQYTESCAQWCVDKVEKNPVIVYGGNGTIGRRICELLLERKIQHVAVGSEKPDFVIDGFNTIISCIPYDKKIYKHNTNFFNRDFFLQFKNGVDFISISRGPTHNNEDLLELLGKEKIVNVHIDTVDSNLRDKLLEYSTFHYYEHTAWKYRTISDEENFRLLQQALDKAKGML